MSAFIWFVIVPAGVFLSAMLGLTVVGIFVGVSQFFRGMP